jgi:phosphoserine aminotransferase
MTAGRIHNFNPGPAALPLSVLTEIQASFTDFGGTGMSITEISHRSKPFELVINDAVARVKRLLGLDDEFQVLFLQGGASLQFAMVPMNFLAADRSADYVNTGTWSTKAIQECQLLGKPHQVVASSEDREFRYIPKHIAFHPDAVYAHITSNNTIRGTQWPAFPDTGGVPLVADMSSDIMSRPFDPRPFGLIYAGAQKNIGPAGVTLVIVRRDFLASADKRLPTMLRYGTFAEKNSLYNTPPCFAIYALQLVLKWLEESIGGLAKMEALNRDKAERLYTVIDKTGFYRGTADADSRSRMNVTFRLPTPELEARFIEEAAGAGLGGLKGHRSVGGCRASLYNAVTPATVAALCDFMTEFERRNG